MDVVLEDVEVDEAKEEEQEIEEEALVKTYFYIKPVGSWRIYIIMVIGAHDSMITIKNGSCNTLARSQAPHGIINKHHINTNIA